MEELIVPVIPRSLKKSFLNLWNYFFKAISPKKEKKLDKLIAHRDAVVGNSDDFVSIDWSNDKSILLHRDRKIHDSCKIYFNPKE